MNGQARLYAGSCPRNAQDRSSRIVVGYEPAVAPTGLLRIDFFVKQRKLVGTAAMFVARHDRFASHTMRFDVVSIEGVTRTRIRWICDAFRPNDSAL